jgi:hypothetical protein
MNAFNLKIGFEAEITIPAGGYLIQSKRRNQDAVT